LQLTHENSESIELRQTLQGMEPGRTYQVRAVLTVPATQQWGRDGLVELSVDGARMEGNFVRGGDQPVHRGLVPSADTMRVLELSIRFQAGAASELLVRSKRMGNWTPRIVMIEAMALISESRLPHAP
jgi:hypothetical protein